MKNEDRIHQLIQVTIRRAVIESAAAAVVIAAFAAHFMQSKPASPTFFGSLLILIAAGFIMGVVWSFALSYKLLRSHPATDVSFWREAFHAQARLLRTVPWWYCAPLAVGGFVFIAPTTPYDVLPFSIIAPLFGAVFAVIIWLNRRAARGLEDSAAELNAA